MGFLDWIRQRGKAAEMAVSEPKPVRPVNFTLKGNPITEQWQSEWHSGHDGLHGYRRHIGRSVEGFHGGVQVSNRTGQGVMVWSNARPTSEAAERVSLRLLDGYQHGFGPSDRAQKLFAEWRQDYQMARERDAVGKKPERRGVQSSEPGESKTAPTPPKRVKVRSRDIPF